ncbi:sensor histidine kinase [Mucilaginibacter flavus]|uniref:sensor histidine kinase n=1 Tax=Mucilaginibacter flavus TaxID=931504 RepID=UPI0025B49EC0|nr:sensor histidine kinase [Mucilaginibacter flavus]MDN3580923.1 histidine kinase [Mucilaginibacter flavus]
MSKIYILKMVYMKPPFSYSEGTVNMKEIINDRFNQYKLHIFLWVIFIFYETVVIGLIIGQFGNPLTYFFHYILIIALFYFHADIGLTWGLKGGLNSIWKVPVLILAETTIYIVVSYGIDVLLVILHTLKPTVNHLTVEYALTNLYRCIYFMGFSTGYYSILRYRTRTNELEKNRLTNIINLQKSEQELIKSQNAFLKAQINPHFLFNTLDFIYHNIESSSQTAAEAVIVLSEMMRYAIDSDKMGDFIALGEEIDQVENFVYLQQMRTNFNLCFKLLYDDEVRNLKFIPLVLLTVVENIFKHGSLHNIDDEATVRVYVENDTFFIVTDNLINNKQQKLNTHIGLKNIEKRLEYTFNGKVSFDYYISDENHFKLCISVPVLHLRAPDGPLTS